MQGRKVSIEEAREISKNVGSSITWRPNPELPESQQYAIVHNDGERKRSSK